RNVGDLVPSFRAGNRDERRPHDGDARAHERLPVGLVGDAARDGAVLGSRDGADAAGEPAEHQKRAQHGTNDNAHTDSSFEVAKHTPHEEKDPRPRGPAASRASLTDWAKGQRGPTADSTRP